MLNSKTNPSKKATYFSFECCFLFKCYKKVDV